MDTMGGILFRPSVGLLFFVNFEPTDIAKQMAAHFAVFPRAGVFVAINDHMRAESAEARDGKLVHRNHRRIARPLDGQGHR